MAPTSIDLTHAFTLKLFIATPRNIPGTPVGDRVYIPVTHGTLSGSGIEAKVSDGGDFAIPGKDNFGKLDVRTHAQTADGEFIYIQYYGHLEITPDVGKLLASDSSAQSTNFGDQYLLTTPVIEVAGNSKHAWINRTVFLGKGRFDISNEGAAVVYEIFKAK